MPIVKLRAAEALAAALDARAAPVRGARATRTGGRAAVAARDLDRYYTLLARDLRAVALTRGEAGLLVALANGTLWEPWSATPALLAAQVEDADPAEVAPWGVDVPALVARLRALTPGQALAVVDACERSWLRTPADGETLDDALAAVGLVRPPG